VRLFHSLSRGDFPSWWLQLLQWPLVSLLGGLTRSKWVCYRNNAFQELLSPPAHLLQWQTCITVLDCYLSMNFYGFHPSPRRSSSVHVASGAAVFTLLLCRRVAFLHCIATCWQPFKPWVTLLPTYRKIERCFEFLSHF
jgi:hypothetical protein